MSRDSKERAIRGCTLFPFTPSASNCDILAASVAHRFKGETVSSSHLTQTAETYLQKLCVKIPTRRVGSAGNRAATDFVAQTVASFGLQTECPEFDCLDWTHGGARLAVGDETFDALVSPYSLGCRVRAPLVVVSSIDELEMVDAAERVLLLRGEIAKEQLMPKNFTFYNPDEHKRIIYLLETKQPRAIVAATSYNPEMAGAVYPFPLIEDGDFDIPSVYMTDVQGERLARHAGAQVSLDIDAHRSAAKAYNVIARQGASSSQRVVLTAHIDAKEGTPGALDDGSGVVALLLLAELLRDYDGQLGAEIAVLNGEDHYSAAGEVHYIKSNQGKFGEILLCVNLDDLGYHEGHTAYSFYDCPDMLANAVRKTFAQHADIVPGEPWYQGDHMIFVQNRVPAVALISERGMELMATITHSAKDTPALVDCAKLTDAAAALHELVCELDELYAAGKMGRG